MATQICRHIRTNGSRCGCIALSGKTFCYYHDRTGKLHRSINPPSDGIETIIHPIEIQEMMQRSPMIAEYYRPKTGPLVLDFPPLEDRESIQIALSMVVTAMAQNRIDPKRAGLMIYGLQVASSNARNLQPSRGDIVTQTVLDEDGQQIAPDEDPESEIVAQQLLELIEQEDAEEAAELAEEREEEEAEERRDKERKAELAAKRDKRLRSWVESPQHSQSQPCSGSTLSIPGSCFAPNPAPVPAPDPTLVDSPA